MSLGSPYFLLLAIGLGLGCGWYVRAGTRAGFPRVMLIDICLGAVIGGVIGGRLLHIAVEPLPSYSLSPAERHDVEADAAKLDAAGRAEVMQALRSPDVPAAWLFIAQMPPGAARDEAVRLAREDRSAVPASLWYRARPLESIKFWKGGLAYLGGLVFGAFVCLAVGFRHARDLGEQRAGAIRDLLDLSAPAIILGLVFGRIGCFLGGCCYGQVCEPSWWATAPAWYTLPAGQVPRYPTALLAAAFAAGLFLVLRALLARKAFKGEVFLAMLVLYAPGRFALEAIRADPRGGAGGLSTSQILGLAVAIPALAAWVGLRLRQRGQERERAVSNL